ncbi:MAG TPA: ribosome maturation factor RimM [Acidobacteriaceae bacterium]|nr:ribosome maturation factor RimM [Acidobacteriaceae bacterium]
MSAEDRGRDFVLLARLIRSQGRHGEMIAEILTDFPERFSERSRVLLLPPDQKAAPREAEIERYWLHKGRIVLKLAGVDSISDAMAMSGWHVAIPREQRAPLTEDTVYVADVIGCHVIDEADGAVDLGPVLAVERGEGGAPDLLVLHTDDEELLIPFAKAFIVQVNLPAQVLRMRLPAGLTTINAPMTEEERAAQQQMSEQDADRDGGNDDAF